MAWLNLTMPNQTVKNCLNGKKIKLPQMDFFLKKQLIKLSCTYYPLSFCKILKKPLELIQSYEDAPFLDPKWSICPKQNFFWKIIIVLIYLLAPFIAQNFKKSFPVNPELWRCAILGPKMAHFPKWELFFRKPYNDPCFLQSWYLHIKKQSQILIY